MLPKRDDILCGDLLSASLLSFESDDHRNYKSAFGEFRIESCFGPKKAILLRPALPPKT